MRAAVLETYGSPLKIAAIDIPAPNQHDLLLRTHCCAVCRTDLHLIDGDIAAAGLPIIPGHQVVGEVVQLGTEVGNFEVGDIVGEPWLGWTCRQCRFCLSDLENLCDSAKFTGCDINGGFAEYCVADARYCFRIPQEFEPRSAAPLLCAGMIGYRAMAMTGDAEAVGFYGFGSAAHLMIQAACHAGRRVFAFTRPGAENSQQFARRLGACWAGGSDEFPPEQLDAAVIFAPVGALVPAALRAVRKGGTVVCAGIHMSDIPSFPYEYLWGERGLRSVANLTRKDGERFFEIAAKVPIRTETRLYGLEQINLAVDDLRNGRVQGSAVIDLSQ